MSEPLIVTFFREIPQPSFKDDPDLWQAGVQEAMRSFRVSIKNNYSEGTLQRLLIHPDSQVRQAAVLGLGLIGTLGSNAALAAILKDEDTYVRRFAHDALWEIWSRGSDPNHCWQLQQAMQLGDFAQTMAALDDLLVDAPAYAEAYNQRAILLFRRGDYLRSRDDCKVVLKLNPYHFGAAAGLGQCYLKLKKPRAALRYFTQALDLNPALDELVEAVRALKDALGDEA